MATKAPKFLYGDELSARKLTQLARFQDEIRRDARLGARPIVAPHQTTLILVEVKSIDNVARTMTCTPPGMTATPNALEYTVELPEIFNETSRGGETYTYSSLNARASDLPEDQEITPNFILNEKFYVIYEFTTQKTVFLGDGRMWAQV